MQGSNVDRLLNQLSMFLAKNGNASISPKTKTRAIELLQIITGQKKHIELKPGYTQCKDCGSPVRIENLKLHATKCPGRPFNSHTKGGNKKKESTNEKTGTKLDDYPEERRLDASRDYYNNYREHGRFGSHSMHDDMHDEAEP